MTAEQTLASSVPATAGGVFPGMTPIVFDAPRGRVARDYLNEARDRLMRDHLSGASGTAIVDRWTRVVDHVVCALFEAARDTYRERNTTLDQRCALIAQGGYGRGELNPWSDIDLLFLYPHRTDAYVETVTESVLYALWDTGMTVGQAVRSVRDCVALASADFKVKTSLLDTRFLTGDEDFYRTFQESMERDVFWRNVPRFIREKVEENEERHHRHGDAVYLVEPHLKDGEGGLRDIHTATWLAKVKFKVHSLEELVVKSVLTPSELREILAARDFLFRVRNALHFLSGRHQDQLTFEHQPRIASELGFADDERSKGVENFMRAYYLHASVVNRFSAEMIARCQPAGGPAHWVGRLASREIRPGVRIVSEELVIVDGAIFDDDPALLLRVAADVQRHDVHFSSGSRRLIRSKVQNLATSEARRSADAARALIDILTWKHSVYETLTMMHNLGVLGAYLPEFENLRCMAQYDRYHIYTVDEHTLHGVRNLELLRAGAFKAEYPLLTSVIREIDDIEILYLGMLYHDIGKGRGGNHSTKGAAMAVETAQRLGLNRDATAQFEFLVRSHLMMHQLATRRDIHEPQMVVDFAKMVGTPEKLKKLYVLTFADLKATNPKLWNSWQDMLLGELYELTVEAFERSEMVEVGQGDHAARIRARVIEGVGAADADDLRAFLEDMPDSYVLATPEDDIPRHFALVHVLGDQLFLSRVEHHPERDFSEFTVVTRNRSGLFAQLTGVLRAKGMSIVGARASTAGSGLAIDVFRVAHLDDGASGSDTDRWQRVVDLVGQVLAGTADVETIVADAGRPSLLGDRVAPRFGTEVDVDNRISPEFTVLDVSTTDRSGVLFAITNALFHLGLRIHLAKITTNVDRALDVFYITDNEDKKVSDDRTESIRKTLITAVDPVIEGGTTPLRDQSAVT